MSEQRTILSPMQRLLGEDFNPALLLILVRKSFAWCLIILLITISASLIYLRYTQPNYEVNASLIVKPTNSAQALDIQNTVFPSKNSNLDIEKDIQIMKSSVIIDRVIDSLSLAVSYFRAGNFLNEELYKNSPFLVHAIVTDPSWHDHPVKFRFLSEKQFQLDYSVNGTETYETYEFGRQYNTPAFTFTATVNEPYFRTAKTEHTESNFFFIVNSRATLYNWIRNTLQIVPSAPTISMLMRDRKPQKAADIVNAVCDEFILYDKEKKTESATLILDFIESQVDSISNDLRKYEDEMTAFKLGQWYFYRFAGK
jgi:capsular polysaccharide biosynthesis protein